MRISIVVSVAVDESEHVHDEQIVKFAFAVGNHQQVDAMFPIAMLRSVERKDFAVFKKQDVDADGWIYFSRI